MVPPIQPTTRRDTQWEILNLTGYDVESEEHIAFVARNAVLKAVTLSEIESARAKDPMLQAIMSVVKSGFWHNAPPDVSLSEPSRYEQVKEQLTCTDTVLLKSDRLVLPATLLERIVDIAQEGHLGIVKTNALCYEKAWFSCMDKMVETKFKACLPCQVVAPVYTREPLHMLVLPDNGEAERFVKTLKKCIKVAKVERRNSREELPAI